MPSSTRPWAVPFALALLVGVACDDETPPPDPPDGDDDVTESRGDPYGLIHVVDAGTHAEVHALFSRDVAETGVIDGLAWLGVVDAAAGYWAPPQDPGVLVPVAELTVPPSWEQDRFYDVGEALTVGDVIAPRVVGWTDPDGFSGDALIYYRDEGGFTPEDLGQLAHLGFRWPGGADAGPASHPGAVDRVDALQLTSHDPAEPLRWFEGQPLSVAWEPAGGEVWVTLLGDRHWLQARVVDEARFVLPADTLAAAVDERFELRIGRTAIEPVDADGGEVWLRQVREQRLSGRRSGVLTVEPDLLRLDATHDVVVTHHDGAFVDGATTFAFGDGVHVDEVTIPAGNDTVAQLRLTVAADATTGPRDLVATVDGVEVPSARAVRLLLPVADRCEDAFTLPGAGVYHGELWTASPDHDDPSACTGYPAEGPDSFFAVEVPDGGALAATVHYPDVDVVLYLAADCDSLAAPLACADAGGINAPETLAFAPLPGQQGTRILVVDTFAPLDDPPADDYELVLELLGG